LTPQVNVGMCLASHRIVMLIKNALLLGWIDTGISRQFGLRICRFRLFVDHDFIA
jgi:hypothetical protein